MQRRGAGGELEGLEGAGRSGNWGCGILGGVRALGVGWGVAGRLGEGCVVGIIQLWSFPGLDSWRV